MYNKKGDFGLPLYFFPAIMFFVFGLVFFAVIFFVIGIDNSPNLVIRSGGYQDSSKVITILRTPTAVQQENKSLNIAELISLAYEKPQYKEQLNNELIILLRKLPLVQKGEGLGDVIIATPSATRESIKSDQWNLDIKVDNTDFSHVGEEASISNNYLVQSANIPLENGKLAEVKLYLNCFACTSEDIDDIV